MSEKKCSKCGTVCSSTARFCIRCRNPLNQGPGKNKTCPKGHRMDPSWSECPFCQSSKPPAPLSVSQGPAIPAMDPRQRTMVEGMPTGAPIPAASPAAAAQPKSDDPFVTIVSPKAPERAAMPAGGMDRSKTRVVTRKAPAGRGKIYGTLVTYTHNPSGTAFLIRGGRNVLGTGESASIRVKDSSVSEKHAIIVASDERLMIDDCLSTNGTYVNGKAVEDKASLKSGDVIQTGETLWRFVAITPPDPKLKVS